MIEWDFIKFEKTESFCIDGITLESEVEFHIYDDEEIIYGKEGDISNYNNISMSFQEQKEIIELAEMYLRSDNNFLKESNNE